MLEQLPGKFPLCSPGSSIKHLFFIDQLPVMVFTELSLIVSSVNVLLEYTVNVSFMPDNPVPAYLPATDASVSLQLEKNSREKIKQK